MYRQSSFESELINMDDYQPTRQSGYGVASFVLWLFIAMGTLFAGLLASAGMKGVHPGGVIYRFAFSTTTFFVLSGILALFGIFLGIVGARHFDRKHSISYVAIVLHVLLLLISIFELSS